MPPCIGDLKSTQERIHINECQFLRLVHEFGIQILVHVERLGWSPRRGRLPQTAMLQDLRVRLVTWHIEIPLGVVHANFLSVPVSYTHLTLPTKA